MKIALGSDHRGFEAKQRIKAMLAGLGGSVTDHGCPSKEACDYPDSALAVAEDVARGDADRGILFCGIHRTNRVTAPYRGAPTATRVGRVVF